MKVLTSRSNSQRQQIKAAYKTLHGKDLVGDLKGELGGKFETLVVALMTPPILYDVTSLRNAIKGAGTDEKVLIEILSSRTAQQIKDITAAYRQECGKDLEEDVTGDTSGHFRRLLVILLQLLDIRTAITHLELDKYFFFNDSDADDLLLSRERAQIPVICMKKRLRKRGRRSGCLLRD
ncbi:annexin A5 isoform X2 [Coregonus clupeaformis]|nr:annexin A5 isoform X2 [Coregonus clupeaformis]